MPSIFNVMRGERTIFRHDSIFLVQPDNCTYFLKNWYLYLFLKNRYLL